MQEMKLYPADLQEQIRLHLVFKLLPSAEWISHSCQAQRTPAAPFHRLLTSCFPFSPSFLICHSVQCTPGCGPGYRHRVVLCKGGESGDTLPESKCPKHVRPTSRVRCNLKRCPPPQWVTGPWGEVGHLHIFTVIYRFNHTDAVIQTHSSSVIQQ